MISYLVDEISPLHMERIQAYLRENTLRSRLNEIFWVPIPEDLLSDVQLAHRDCHPYVFAVEKGRNWIKAECLIRSLANMKCEAQAYCDSGQRDFIMAFINRMIKDLGIHRLLPKSFSLFLL